MLPLFLIIYCLLDKSDHCEDLLIPFLINKEKKIRQMNPPSGCKTFQLPRNQAAQQQSIFPVRSSALLKNLT